MEIRSYRRVFDLERRVYSVDRLRLNPGGVPLRGIVYFVAILAVGTLAARLPLLGGLVDALPWYLRDLALPGMSATVLGAIRIEGRSFHLAARALARHACGPRRLALGGRKTTVGQCWRPPEIALLPDGSDARMRCLSYTGPGAVLVAREHELGMRARRRRGSISTRASRSTLMLRQPDGAAVLDRRRVIALAAGARLLVRATTVSER
ncbi:MAG TPA: hypothetical protein VFY36_05145 [Solirubrobacteraceae bacterium]|nr:hypothetical protein [Solirubrobacteraceae bacterium]